MLLLTKFCIFCITPLIIIFFSLLIISAFKLIHGASGSKGP